MSCDIITKGGKKIGHLSDSMDGDDYLVVDNKKVSLSDVYRDKELKDSFNDSIKTDKDITNTEE
jgi:hypothetical protein